jgi:hypothetical protein
MEATRVNARADAFAAFLHEAPEVGQGVPAYSVFDMDYQEWTSRKAKDLHRSGVAW